MVAFRPSPKGDSYGEFAYDCYRNVWLEKGIIRPHWRDLDLIDRAAWEITAIELVADAKRRENLQILRKPKSINVEALRRPRNEQGQFMKEGET